MSDPLLDCVEIGPDGKASASVIWLHGLGADGYDFEPIVPELGLPPGCNVRFVFPHAPRRPVTINGGMRMRAWYDIDEIGPAAAEDAEGIHTSALQIERLIERERRHGVGAGKLVLAGFSQGGAIALHAGLRHPERLAGVLALSTYLPLRHSLADERSEANRETPIFMAHGLWDQVVPYAFGRGSRDALQYLGYRVEWREYPMEHSVSLEEIRDIGAWLRRVLEL